MAEPKAYEPEKLNAGVTWKWKKTISDYPARECEQLCLVRPLYSLLTLEKFLFRDQRVGAWRFFGGRLAPTSSTVRLTSRTVSRGARRVIVCSLSLGLLTVDGDF